MEEGTVEILRKGKKEIKKKIVRYHQIEQYTYCGSSRRKIERGREIILRNNDKHFPDFIKDTNIIIQEAPHTPK